MTDVSTEVREFVRSDLASLAEHLMKSCGWTAHQARRFIREMLDVSV